VSSTDVSRSLSNYVSGQSVSEFRNGDEVFPIVIRALADFRPLLKIMAKSNIKRIRLAAQFKIITIKD